MIIFVFSIFQHFGRFHGNDGHFENSKSSLHIYSLVLNIPVKFHWFPFSSCREMCRINFWWKKERKKNNNNNNNNKKRWKHNKFGDLIIFQWVSIYHFCEIVLYMLIGIILSVFNVMMVSFIGGGNQSTSRKVQVTDKIYKVHLATGGSQTYKSTCI